MTEGIYASGKEACAKALAPKPLTREQHLLEVIRKLLFVADCLHQLTGNKEAGTYAQWARERLAALGLEDL